MSDSPALTTSRNPSLTDDNRYRPSNLTIPTVDSRLPSDRPPSPYVEWARSSLEGESSPSSPLSPALLQFSDSLTLPSLHDGYVLHHYCFSGNLLEVMNLIKRRADLNMLDRFNRTGLHYASVQGHTDVVRALVRRKDVAVDVGDSFGFTPLALGSMKGKAACCEVLVQIGKADRKRLSLNEDQLSPVDLALTEETQDVFTRQTTLEQEFLESVRRSDLARLEQLIPLVDINSLDDSIHLNSPEPILLSLFSHVAVPPKPPQDHPFRSLLLSSRNRFTREMVVTELLQTERTYCENLEIAVSLFAEPCLAPRGLSRLIKKRSNRLKIRELFTRITSLRDLHCSSDSGVCSRLEEAIGSIQRGDFSDHFGVISVLFDEFDSFAGSYQQYVSLQSDVEDLIKSNREFKDLLIWLKAQARRIPLPKAQNFISVLSLPRIRIFKYRDLFLRLVDHTDNAEGVREGSDENETRLYEIGVRMSEKMSELLVSLDSIQGHVQNQKTVEAMYTLWKTHFRVIPQQQQEAEQQQQEEERRRRRQYILHGVDLSSYNMMRKRTTGKASVGSRIRSSLRLKIDEILGIFVFTDAICVGEQKDVLVEYSFYDDSSSNKVVFVFFDDAFRLVVYGEGRRRVFDRFVHFAFSYSWYTKLKEAFLKKENKLWFTSRIQLIPHFEDRNETKDFLAFSQSALSLTETATDEEKGRVMEETREFLETRAEKRLSKLMTQSTVLREKLHRYQGEGEIEGEGEGDNLLPETPDVEFELETPETIETEERGEDANVEVEVEDPGEEQEQADTVLVEVDLTSYSDPSPSPKEIALEEEFQKVLSEKEEQINERDTELLEKESYIAQLADKLKIIQLDLDKERHLRSSDVSSLRQTLLEAEEAKTSADSGLELKDREIESLMSQLTTEQARASRLESSLEDFRTLADQREELAEDESQAAQLAIAEVKLKMRADFEATVSLHERELSEMSQERNSIEASLHSLEQQYKHATSELETRTTELNSVESERDQMQELLYSLQREVNDVREAERLRRLQPNRPKRAPRPASSGYGQKRLFRSKKRRKTKSQELTSLRTDLRRSRNKIYLMKQDTDLLVSKMRDREAQLEVTIASLHDELRASERQKQSLQHQVDANRVSEETLETALATLRDYEQRVVAADQQLKRNLVRQRQAHHSPPVSVEEEEEEEEEEPIRVEEVRPDVVLHREIDSSPSPSRSRSRRRRRVLPSSKDDLSAIEELMQELHLARQTIQEQARTDLSTLITSTPPPTPIFDMIKASLLLFGYTRREVEHWRFCRKMISSGRFLAEVLAFRPSKADAIRSVRSLLIANSRDEVFDSSILMGQMFDYLVVCVRAVMSLKKRTARSSRHRGYRQSGRSTTPNKSKSRGSPGSGGMRRVLSNRLLKTTVSPLRRSMSNTTRPLSASRGRMQYDRN